MDLRYLIDSQLLKDTYSLVQNEREQTTTILHHLCEIDRRKLYSDIRCSSLYDYCTRVLGYAEASAQRRIRAARLMLELPEIEVQIECGRLSLSNIAQASTFFTQENITALEEKKEILAELEGLTRREAEKRLFEISGNEIPARESKKRISDTKNIVSIILTDETLEKLDTVKGLIGKNLSQEKLISMMADIAIERITKKKFKYDFAAM
ncbi:MAG TPA: hypothetical protein VNJ08_06405 [Bacteriovoracaceae bacterium]|nr:hypothetical protein [Bacteriovoracaceae bacterium]